uniref:Cadherin domain-containing protein n=1 Tax=Parastrongyloides trichosuri TaxID=131310 RepID=A0A0N4ZDP2_PARTI
MYGVDKEYFRINGKGELVMKNSVKINNSIGIINENNIRTYFVTIIEDALKCKYDLYEGEIEEKKKIFIKPVKVNIINGNNIIYSLMEEDSNFKINPKNGILSIDSEEFLTIDNLGEKFNLSVIGTDRYGNQTTCTVQITLRPEKSINEKVAIFSKDEYNFEISPGVTEIGKVELMLSDYNYNFKIIEGSVDRVMIDEKNGNLRYIGDPIIENEKMELLIMARNDEYYDYVNFVRLHLNFDGLHSDSAKFLNDDKVTFILLNQSQNDVILKIFNGSDGDAKSNLIFNIEYIKILNKLRNEIIDNNIEEDRKKFVINDNILYLHGRISKDISNVEIKVSIKDSLHNMEPKDYAYVYIAFKSDVIKKSRDYLTLLEHPDIIFVDEKRKKGDFVYTIQPKPISKSLEEVKEGRDVNNYNFRIVEGDGFSINETSGLIVIDNIPKESTNLIIEVEDLNNNDLAETSITINIVKSNTDVNTKKYNFNVREDVTVGYIIGYLEKNEALIGDDSSKFEINDNNALIVKSPLDYEKQNEYLFFVVDNEIRIHILDVNDNIPITDRSSLNLTIMDNIQPGSILEHLNVTDKDKLDNLRFTFSGNGIISRKLMIDENHNIIARESFIDILKNNINFQIICSDGLHKISINITLNIIGSVNCVPVFNKNQTKVYLIEENISINNNDNKILIGHIKASSDKDCLINYEIIDEEKKLPFTINNITGEIYLKETLDYEEREEYKFKVKINSENKEKEGIFVIKVIDKNDHTPVFLTNSSLYSIPEDFYVGEVITKVEAFDKDVNDLIYYHIITDSDKFYINITTGEVVLVKPLDKEETDEYVLNVYATNEEFLMLDVDGSFDMMRIIILIEDINDNGPIFDLDNYEIVVGRNMNPGEKIIQLHTHDKDNDKYVGNVDFKIDDVRFHFQGRSRQAPSYIYINKNGEVILNNYIDDFSGGFLTATVYGKDVSTIKSTFVGKCSLKIWICSNNHLTNIILNDGPMKINYKKMVQSIKRLSERVENAHVMIQNFGYYQKDGIFSDNKTIAKVVFIKDGEEMISCDDVIKQLEKYTLIFGNGESFEIEKNNDNFERYEEKKSDSKLSIVSLTLALFSIALLSIFLVIACIMLRDRTKFLNDKQNFINEEIVAITKENNNILALSSKPSYGEINYYGNQGITSSFHTSQLHNDDCYSIQTMKINLGKAITETPFIEEVD